MQYIIKGKVCKHFLFELLQKAISYLKLSGLHLLPVIQIQKCHDGFMNGQKRMMS